MANAGSLASSRARHADALSAIEAGAFPNQWRRSVANVAFDIAADRIKLTIEMKPAGRS